MNIKKAKDLLSKDISKMSEDSLQKYKVLLLDAWRYAKGDYGYKNDFFYYLEEVKGFVPVDKWLLQNINKRLDLIGV